MKRLKFLFCFFVPIFSLAQTKSGDSTAADIQKTELQYIAGDRIITCKDCKVDYCGNLINAGGDTITLLKQGPILYFTSDHLLLSSESAKDLANRKQIRAIDLILCKDGQKLFGDLAKNGIMLLDIKPINGKYELLVDRLNRIYPNKNISMELVLINGLVTRDAGIKVLKDDNFKLEYDSNKNLYYIKME